MKLVHHIQVANMISKKLDNKLKEGFTINKLAFYLGSISPDLNCIYPAHRLSTTANRFQKRVKRVDNFEHGLVRSFTLGVITHYVCDYFCYAHNIESLGFPHKNYETGLYKYFKTHRDMFIDNEDLVVEWKDAKEIMQKKCLRGNNTMNMDLHAEMIMEQIRILNLRYLEKSINHDNKEWVNSDYQWNNDLEYAVFMCECILSLVVEPVRCVSGVLN